MKLIQRRLLAAPLLRLVLPELTVTQGFQYFALLPLAPIPLGLDLDLTPQLLQLELHSLPGGAHSPGSRGGEFQLRATDASVGNCIPHVRQQSQSNRFQGFNLSCEVAPSREQCLELLMLTPFEVVANAQNGFQ